MVTPQQPVEARLGSDDEITQAALLASRALVAIAARSLNALHHDVTLPQFRALVVLSTAAPQNLGQLSSALGVHPSTATRLCDRLSIKGLINRHENPRDRREVALSLTRRGQRLVERITEYRRTELAQVMARIPTSRRRAIIHALEEFTAAAQTPDDAWALGWPSH